jgi:hypothetical protein
VNRIVTRKQQTIDRQLSHDCASIVSAAREARAALSAVVKLAERRRRETTAIDDAGMAITNWERMTPRDRVEALQMSLTWMNEAEKHTRQTRMFLERALERAERRVL